MMKRNKKRLSVLLCCALLLTGNLVVQAKEEIKHSTVDYEVSIQDASRVFVGNQKAVDWEVGDKYFLTYTVADVVSNETTQSGMIVTTDCEEAYPYTKGGLQYDTKSLLCEEGYTYFFRFEVTEKGMRYVVAKSKGQESESYVKLPHEYGNLQTKGTHFGAWFAEGGNVTVKLTHVRCYDEQGNDLGVYGNSMQNVNVYQPSEMQMKQKEEHSYSFSLQEARCVAFGNARLTNSDVVFLEYTISNVKASGVTQSGVTVTSAPTAMYPHGDGSGYLNYSPHDATLGQTRLLDEGAKYLFRFEREKDTFTVLVKKTLGGQEEYFSFPHYFGNYSEAAGYVTTWIGENCSLSADFTDVKCYDAQGNNLGIQTNQGVKIKHYGNLEDYSQCAATYYCDAIDTFLTLDDDCNASRRVDGEDNAEVGTYSIRETILTFVLGENREEFNYVYAALTDKDGNRYVRLRDVEVTFHSKFMNGKELETVKVTAADGYKLKQPKTPENSGQTFLYWQTGSGEQYDFNKVVTRAMDLYAVWDGEETWTLTSMLGSPSDTITMVIVGVVCIVLIVGTVAGTTFLSRRKKNGKKN